MSKKNLQKNAIYFGVVFTVLIISYQYFHSVQVNYLRVTTFKECVDAGYSVLTTYPEKCIMAGKSFINPNQDKVLQVEPKITLEKSYRDETYIVDGEQIQFINGSAELPPNQLLKQGTTTLEIAGEPFMYDINADTIPDTIFLFKTAPLRGQKSAYYVSSLVSLNRGFFGLNAVFLDYSLTSSMFVYKNGEIAIGYTTEQATTTVRQKYFVLEGGILKQLSHK